MFVGYQSTFIKTGGKIAGNPTGFAGLSPNVATRGITASGSAVSVGSSGSITIGGVTSGYFNGDLGENANTPVRE
jgi:hypothetical protein